MKSLLWTEGCCHHPNYGQAAIWRWWYYYQQHKNALGVTHFAVMNNGNTHMPVEFFTHIHPAEEPIPELVPGHLHVVTFKDYLGYKDMHTRPHLWRNLFTVTDLCYKHNFDRFILIETDAIILHPDMLHEIGQTETGCVSYWCPRHNFPEASIIIVGKDKFNHVSGKAKELFAKDKCDEADRLEVALEWTVVRSHRKGDRYPEFGNLVPGDAHYCCQMGINGRLTYERAIEVVS